jgi:hypothetical protein
MTPDSILADIPNFTSEIEDPAIFKEQGRIMG